MQFMVLAYDGTDAQALQRRLAVRDQHIKLGDQMKQAGEAICGAALLDDTEQMIGSVYIVDFPSRAEVDAWLEREPYMRNNVWQDVRVIPCKVGPSFT